MPKKRKNSLYYDFMHSDSMKHFTSRSRRLSKDDFQKAMRDFIKNNMTGDELNRFYKDFLKNVSYNIVQYEYLQDKEIMPYELIDEFLVNNEPTPPYKKIIESKFTTDIFESKIIDLNNETSKIALKKGSEGALLISNQIKNILHMEEVRNRDNGFVRFFKWLFKTDSYKREKAAINNAVNHLKQNANHLVDEDIIDRALNNTQKDDIEKLIRASVKVYPDPIKGSSKKMDIEELTKENVVDKKINIEEPTIVNEIEIEKKI